MSDDIALLGARVMSFRLVAIYLDSFLVRLRDAGLDELQTMQGGPVVDDVCYETGADKGNNLSVEEGGVEYSLPETEDDAVDETG